MKYSYVYLLASKRNGTLYIGVTSDLRRRVFEHKADVVRGFTQRYNVKRLVWCDDIEAAIQREKQLKKWNRAWKLSHIEKTNPKWYDLYEDIV